MIGSELLLLFIVFHSGENTKSIETPKMALACPRDVRDVRPDIYVIAYFVAAVDSSFLIGGQKGPGGPRRMCLFLCISQNERYDTRPLEKLQSGWGCVRAT